MSNIITHTKRRFDPTTAAPEDLRVADIAHALSLLCRGNGQLPHFYSIAQHSLACADEAAARGYSRAVQRFCLLHDASEAYLSDITRPVKLHLPRYREIEAALQALIYKTLARRLPTAEEAALLRSVDDCMLYHEFMELMGEPLFSVRPEVLRMPGFSFRPFDEVEAAFLARYAALSEDFDQ